MAEMSPENSVHGRLQDKRKRLLPETFLPIETAVTKVLADILLALDADDLSMPTLLDLSAAFDTVDHETLLRRLEVSSQHM